jgi:hypothetical protein
MNKKTFIGKFKIPQGMSLIEFSDGNTGKLLEGKFCRADEDVEIIMSICHLDIPEGYHIEQTFVENNEGDE